MDNYSNNELVQEYIKQLDEKNKISHEVAIKSLGSSYDIEKSQGYLLWLKKKTNNN